MRKGDNVYFAPDYTFTQLISTDNPVEVIKAYQERIIGFYFRPARLLNEKKAGFGAGILCFSAIDAIARTEYGIDESGERTKDWISSNLPDFKNLDSKQLGRIYDEFRCGLVHEARIKNGGQFTYDIQNAVEIDKDSIIFINPGILLNQIELAFEDMIKDWLTYRHPEDYRDLILEDFNIDISLLERQLKCGNPDCVAGQDSNTGEKCIYCDGTGIDPDQRYEAELERAEDAAYFSEEPKDDK